MINAHSYTHEFSRRARAPWIRIARDAAASSLLRLTVTLGTAMIVRNLPRRDPSQGNSLSAEQGLLILAPKPSEDACKGSPPTTPQTFTVEMGHDLVCPATPICPEGVDQAGAVVYDGGASGDAERSDRCGRLCTAIFSCKFLMCASASAAGQIQRTATPQVPSYIQPRERGPVPSRHYSGNTSSSPPLAAAVATQLPIYLVMCPAGKTSTRYAAVRFSFESLAVRDEPIRCAAQRGRASRERVFSQFHFSL